MSRNCGFLLDVNKQLIYAMESQFDYYAEQEAREEGFDWLYATKE